MKCLFDVSYMFAVVPNILNCSPACVSPLKFYGLVFNHTSFRYLGIKLYKTAWSLRNWTNLKSKNFFVCDWRTHGLNEWMHMHTVTAFLIIICVSRKFAFEVFQFYLANWMISRSNHDRQITLAYEFFPQMYFPANEKFPFVISILSYPCVF